MWRRPLRGQRKHPFRDADSPPVSARLRSSFLITRPITPCRTRSCAAREFSPLQRFHRRGVCGYRSRLFEFRRRWRSACGTRSGGLGPALRRRPPPLVAKMASRTLAGGQLVVVYGAELAFLHGSWCVRSGVGRRPTPGSRNWGGDDRRSRAFPRHSRSAPGAALGGCSPTSPASTIVPSSRAQLFDPVEETYEVDLETQRMHQNSSARRIGSPLFRRSSWQRRCSSRWHADFTTVLDYTTGWCQPLN